MSELDPNDDELVAKLRALPGEGTEPDWNQLAQRIHASLPAEVRRPWWRTLLQPRWLAPILAGAVGLGIVAVVVTRTDAPRTPVAIIRDAGHDDARDAAVEPPDEDDDDFAAIEPGDMMLWLDGTGVTVDSAAEDALEVDDLLLGKSTERAEGLLTTDDSWVDALDDDSVAAVDRWIDQQMKKKKG